MWTSWICSSTLLGIDCLRLALWNQSHYPTAADPSGIMCRQSNKCHWSVAACTCLHTPLCRLTCLCSYLSFQDAQLPRRGIRSPCRQSCRRSSHSRRSLGHLRTSARLAADRLPCLLPAGTLGRGQVTCWRESGGEKRRERWWTCRRSSQISHQMEHGASLFLYRLSLCLSIHRVRHEGDTKYLITNICVYSFIFYFLSLVKASTCLFLWA